MKTIDKLTPFVATHPGEILLDELEANEISQVEFAKLIGIRKSQLNEIIKGKRNINADLAILIESALEIDAEYWLELQRNYDLDKAKVEARNQKQIDAIEQLKYLKTLIPYNFLKKEKVVTGDPIEDIPNIKAMYGINEFEQFASLSVQPNYVRFRQYKSDKVDNKNVIAWIKLVQFKADSKIISKFNYDNKDRILTSIKEVLFENVNVINRVEKILSENGIKLIIQNKGEKTPIDGVSFWSDGNPAIGLSLRFKRLDYFAFTLFHELGHIFEHLLNDNKAEFIDIDPKLEEEKYKKSKEEIEANQFAEYNLISQNKWKEFVGNKGSIYSFDDNIITRFSNSNKINPAIVKGRLCRYFDNYKLKSSIINEVF